MLDFLVEELGLQSSSTVAMPVAAVETSQAPAKPRASMPLDVEPEPTEALANGVPFLVVRAAEGDPGQIGCSHGQALRRWIRSELTCIIDAPASDTVVAGGLCPGPWSEEIAGLARGAEVNQEAVTLWNLRTEPLSALRTSFAKPDDAPATPMGRNSITLVQVRTEHEGLAYLTIGRAGRVAATAGVNAARLVCSCEPLDETIGPNDAVAAALWLQGTLASARSVNDVAARINEISLLGRWSVCISQAGAGSEYVWLCCDRGVVRDDEARTREQSLFHAGLNDQPDHLTLFDRFGGTAERVSLESLLGVAISSADAGDAQPAVAEPTVMHRHVMRTIPSNRPKSADLVYRKGDLVWVAGNSAGSSRFNRMLADRGCRVREIRSDAPCGEFGQLPAGELPKHLIVLEDTELPLLDEFSAETHFLDRFELCRCWIEALEKAGALEGASLAAATRMGGDFAFRGDVPCFAGGGMTGLLKGIRREYPAVRVKVVDFDAAADADTIALELIAEMDSGSREAEVGIRAGRRYVVQALRKLPSGAGANLPTQGGVWVVSGGGRGVTSAVAHELGRRFGLRLHLLGTASVPDPDASWRGLTGDQLKELKRQVAIEARQAGKSPALEWTRVEKAIELDRNLKSFAAAGIEATYHVCDIRDRASLGRVLDRIRAGDGSIQGIIHGAGIEAACRFTRKKRDSVRATIASKCDGAANLIVLTRNDPLEGFVSFGSTSGRFGGLGQADYSLASDLLAKMTNRFGVERPECKAIAFHWPAWDGVGMAVRPESRMALKSGGIAFMPVSEGVDHLIQELRSAESEREILILDKPDFLDTDGTMTRMPESVESDENATGDSARVLSDSPGKRQETRIDSPRASLITSLLPGQTPGEYVAQWPLDAERDPFLVNHRLRRRPFLPGVMSMEAMAEAASLLRPSATLLGFRDVQLINGWSIDPILNAEARIRLTETEHGVRCELTGPVHNTRHEVVEENRLYAKALVEFGDASARIEAIDPGKPLLGWNPFVYPDELVMYHGPPFRTLTQLALQHGGGRAIIEARPRNELIGNRPDGEMLVPAAVLDGCMYACGSFTFCMVENIVEIPSGIDAFRQARLPRDGEKCVLRLFYRGGEDNGSVYDFVLIGESGDAILQVKGYRSVRLAETGNVD